MRTGMYRHLSIFSSIPFVLTLATLALILKAYKLIKSTAEADGNLACYSGGILTLTEVWDECKLWPVDGAKWYLSVSRIEPQGTTNVWKLNFMPVHEIVVELFGLTGFLWCCVSTAGGCRLRSSGRAVRHSGWGGRSWRHDWVLQELLTGTRKHSSFSAPGPGSSWCLLWLSENKLLSFITCDWH